MSARCIIDVATVANKVDGADCRNMSQNLGKSKRFQASIQVYNAVDTSR